MKRDQLAADRPRKPPTRCIAPRYIALGSAAAATLALAAAIIHWKQPPSAEAELAASLAGERWYAVVFGHKPIGHYRAVNSRTEDGDFEFRTLLHFKLGDTTEMRIEDQLVFHKLPPHLLEVATHTIDAGGAHTRVVIDSLAGQFAEVTNGEEIRRHAVDATLPMRDYLAVELALANAAPPVGEVGNARAVDFDQLTVVTHRWRILRRAGDVVEIAKHGREHDTLVRLDRSLVPVWMRFGELLELQRIAHEKAAQAWRSEVPLFASARHRVAVSGAIRQPSKLHRLAMAVEGDTTGSWPSTVTLDIDAHRRAEKADVDRAQAVTLRYPADDPQVRTLAEQAVAGLDTVQDRAHALTLFVHNFLDYRDIAHPRTVFDTLRDRHGDCTEFADLYTTIARAVGVPARTVVGLAYRAASPLEEGVFSLHAWNEVAIDERWRSVDPTWGQTRLAATHLPLPADAALAAIAELPRLRFRVLEASYGPPLSRTYHDRHNPP